MTANELANPTREGYVKEAEEWLGIKEGTNEHVSMIELFNSIQNKYKVNTKDAWCAIFVSLVNVLSGGSNVSTSFPISINCEDMICKFKNKKRWKVNDGTFIPQYGDVVFYDWNGNGKAQHVGIITNVTAGTSNITLTVIEGNYSNQVKNRTVKLDSKQIIGFGLPRFR